MSDKQDNENRVPENTVTITVFSGGKSKDETVRFHTPTMRDKIRGSEDGCSVKVAIKNPDDGSVRILAEGQRDDVVKTLDKAIFKSKDIGNEFRKFAQFIMDHSNLRAVGVNAICMDENGNDTGFGFAVTAPDCTVAQAIALVNCGDANMDEFVTKAKLDIPGRHGDQDKGTVIAPTREQVEKLG